LAGAFEFARDAPTPAAESVRVMHANGGLIDTRVLVPLVKEYAATLQPPLVCEGLPRMPAQLGPFEEALGVCPLGVQAPGAPSPADATLARAMALKLGGARLHMVSETHVGTTVIDGVVAALEAAGVTASTLAASAVAAGRSTADHIDESVAALRTQLASAEAALGAGGDGSRSAALRAVAAQLLAQADEADAAANTEVEGGGTAAEMGASGKESAQPIASPRGDSPRVMAAAEPVMAAESVVAAEPVVDGEVSEEAADALMAAGKAVDAERLYRVLLARHQATHGAQHIHTLDASFNLALCRALQAENCEARSDWAEAAKAYVEAADLCAPQHGEDDPQVAEWREAARVIGERAVKPRRRR